MTATLVAPGIERRSDRGLAIAGIRLTLYEIMDLVKAGWSSEEILEFYPLTASAWCANLTSASGIGGRGRRSESERWSGHRTRRRRQRFAPNWPR
jgi:hypothetical protein